MKIIDAINTIDSLKPNTYTQTQKIGWLSILDGMIKRDVIDTHELEEPYEWSPYTDDTDLETELIVEAPYDDMYVKWLEAKIDYSNAEYAKYNNSIMAYNEIYMAYFNFYNRTHMPLETKAKYY